MTVRAILFDKDGVLVDFHGTWGVAALANALKFDLETAQYHPGSPFISGAGADTLMAWDPILGTMRNQDLCRRIFRLFTEYGRGSVAAAPALRETLDMLRERGFPLGIATNDHEDSAKAQMEKLGVKDRFDLIMGADSGHGAKPGPGMMLAFAAHCQIEPSEMIMVGDTFHDLRAAKAAGAIRVAIGTGLPDLVARLQ